MTQAAQCRIRQATLDDAAAIAEIYNEAILTTTATFDTEPKSVDDRANWIRSHTGRFPVLVAETSAGVIGWASLSPWSDRCAYSDVAETSFYVHSSARGQGIGRALKRAIIQAAADAGFFTLIARVAEGSDASLHINLSEGFALIGTMKKVGFKFGRRLDVRFLQLMLQPNASGTPATPCR